MGWLFLILGAVFYFSAVLLFISGANRRGKHVEKS